MPIYTKPAVEVFNPIDGGGLPRGVDMEDGQVWGTEVETRVEEIATSTQSQIDAIQAEVDSVTSVVSQPDAYQAWWNVKRLLSLETADIYILGVGDSTSNEVGELFYKMAAELFADFTSWTVKYYLFDFGSGAWSSPSTVQVGTGSRTIHFSNASYNGSTMDAFTGRHRAAILAAGGHLVIINHGHNYNAYYDSGSFGFSAEDTYYRLDEAIETIAYYLADVPILVHLQNPRYGSVSVALDERAHRAWEKVARKRGGISLVNCRRLWIEANRPLDWYAIGDDTHPRVGGAGITADFTEHKRCFNTSKGQFPNPPRQRTVCKRIAAFDAKNMLVYGRFLGGFSSGIPAGWSKTGSGTSTEITVDVSHFSTRSVSLEDNVYLSQAVSSDVLARIKGRTIVLAGLVKIEGGNEFADAGYIKCFGGIGGEAYNGSVNAPGTKSCWHRHGYPYANGGYAWKFFHEKVPYTATSFTVAIFGGEGETNGRYALWSAVGLFLREDFDEFETWF